ncbi:MAG TPA: YceI family protein [Vicinamibacterales bacterium]|nr:YceI family protein [Vicinamibacterales bacterium]
MSTAQATAAATATAWKIDPAHSQIEFAIRHLMITTVKGRFSKVDGTIRTDAADRSKSEVDVTVDVASIDTREAQRDAHLRSADFFDVEQFPTITYKSRRVIGVDGNEFKVVGDLTIHGVTREVTLDVIDEGRTIDPWGGHRAGFTATTRIRRSEFGLTWNQALETGGFVVGDDVKVNLELELVKS